MDRNRALDETPTFIGEPVYGDFDYPGYVTAIYPDRITIAWSYGVAGSQPPAYAGQVVTYKLEAFDRGDYDALYVDVAEVAFVKTPVYLQLTPAQAQYFVDNPEAFIMAKDDRGYLLVGNWDGVPPSHPDELGGVYLTPNGAEWYGGCESGSSDFDAQKSLAAYVAKYPDLLDI